MRKGDSVVTVTVVLLLGLGAALGAAGFQVSTHRHVWFFLSTLCFAFAVLVPLAYYGIHPLFVLLNEWRRGFLAKHREPKPLRSDRLKESRTTQAAQPVGGSLEIVEALYGNGQDRSTSMDVTETVKHAVSVAGLEIEVCNEAFGGDPLPNQVKLLDVTYRVNGTEMRRTFDEGKTAVLP